MRRDGLDEEEEIEHIIKLIRDQTSAFTRNFNALRQELATVKAQRESDREGIAAMFEAQAQELEQRAGQARSRELEQCIIQDRRDAKAAHVSMEARVADLEQLVEGQRHDLGALGARMQALQGLRMEQSPPRQDWEVAMASPYRAGVRPNEEVEELWTWLNGEVAAREKLEATVNSRVSKLESEVQQLLSERNANRGVNLEAAACRAPDPADDNAGLLAHYSCIKGSLEYIGNKLTTSPSRHSRELQAAFSTLQTPNKDGRVRGEAKEAAQHLDKLHRAVVGRCAALNDVNYSSMKERVSQLENMLGDLADTTAQELGVVKATLQEIGSSLRPRSRNALPTAAIT